MTRWPKPLYDFYRKLVGRYTIDDPRPIAGEVPYTFFLPTENEALALRPDDSVQLIFRSHPPGREWSAERMWVTIADCTGDRIRGRLDNRPSDIPQLKPGHRIVFSRTDIIDIDWAAERETSPPPPSQRRSFWERCMVDDCVLRGDSLVDYLYREEADMTEEEDRFPDSGWRIRGTEQGIAADEAAERSPQYVALGAVLNHDDSWLSLIDAPIGSAYQRHDLTGVFEPCAR